MNLSKAGKITRIENSVAAGQTLVTSATVDTKGFEGTEFIVLFGAIDPTAVTSVYAQGSHDDSTYVTLANTGIAVAADDDNQVVVLDIGHSQYRYLRCLISRATADSTIDGTLVIQYDAQVEPVSHDSATVVAAEHHHAPASGAA